MSGEFEILTEELNDMEADIVISMLKAYGVDAHKEYAGASSIAKIYLGTAVCGVRVMVPPEKLEEAKQLLEATPVFEDVEGEIE
jgi:hypothetical protein